MRWMISTLETVRPDKGFCETDMAVITILSSLGEFFLDAGDRERAKEYLLKAHRLARAYDMTPIEQVVTCRFLRVGWKDGICWITAQAVQSISRPDCIGTQGRNSRSFMKCLKRSPVRWTRK